MKNSYFFDKEEYVTFNYCLNIVWVAYCYENYPKSDNQVLTTIQKSY